MAVRILIFVSRNLETSMETFAPYTVQSNARRTKFYVLEKKTSMDAQQQMNV